MSTDDFCKLHPALARLPTATVGGAWKAIEGWGLPNHEFMPILEDWLNNFDDDDIPLALKIITRLDYYTEARLSKEADRRLNTLAKMGVHLSGALRNALFVLPDNPTDSAARHAYMLSKMEALNGVEPLHISQILQPPRWEHYLVCFNDTYGTGNQFINTDIWPRLNGHIAPENIFVVGIVVAKRARQAFSKLGFKVVPSANARNVFDEFTEAEIATIRQIGVKIAPKFPLGYGDIGLLVAYSFQCPNNTIPLVWGERQRKSGFPWAKLFAYHGKSNSTSSTQRNSVDQPSPLEKSEIIEPRTVGHDHRFGHSERQDMERATPRIFISYSHDTNDHKERVLSLSERLRADGIITGLDRYVTGTPAQGWPRWMLNQIAGAQFILLVCTATYYRRFRGHEEPGKGKGVDWEGAVITQELYDSRSPTTKFVPVLFDATDKRFIPEPVRPHTFYVLNSAQAYQALYDFLLDQAGVEPGSIGELKRKTRVQAKALVFGGEPCGPGHTSVVDQSNLQEVPVATVYSDTREGAGRNDDQGRTVELSICTTVNGDVPLRDSRSQLCAAAAKTILDFGSDAANRYITQRYALQPSDQQEKVLQKLLEDALDDPGFVSKYLTLSAGQCSSAVQRTIYTRINRLKFEIIRPAELVESVNKRLIRSMGRVSSPKFTFFHTSCLGVRDSLNVAVHARTLTASTVEIGVNHPDLLLALAFDRDDPQLRGDPQYLDNYLFHTPNDGYNVDILRKFAVLLSNLQNLIDEFNKSFYPNQHSLIVRFFRKDRPIHTFRVIIETGEFFFFPHPFSVPRPLATFGLYGVDDEICNALVQDLRQTCPTDFTLDANFLAALRTKAVRDLALRFRRIEIEPSSIEQVRSQMRTKTGVDAGFGQRFLDEMRDQMSLEIP